MIPILYDKTGNTKITNLTDCIQCIVTEERNGMFEAELVYSVHSSNSDKLIRGNIIVADANDTLKGQKFRIYKITKPINGRIKILARHISFDMARDVVTGLVIDNQSCEYALNKLFSSSQFSQHFVGHSDIVNSQSTVINGTTHILKAIVGVEGSIIDTFGTSPEILRDNYDFYIYENRGHDNGVTIEYGKNLTGLNLDTDDSNMITRIRAIAKYRDENQEEVVVVSSPEFIDSPYINNYETPFIQEIDFSSHFKDGDVPTPIRLKTLAENYFTNNKCDLPSENATLSFIPLSKCVGYEGIQDKISLCDTVTVIDYRYNLTTKEKVIKVSYNTLKERYENMEVGEPRSRLGDIISNSMNSVKGEKGEKGDKGDKGEDGSIGDFPDSLPATPILTSSLYGFASIELSWTFESQPYYTYELYASRTENFTPNEFDLLFEGKGSTFLFQAKPNETWYFKVRCVNTHGRGTNFSNQVTVTTTKVDDLSNYVDNAAIGDALIGTLTLDRGWVGTLKGNYIDAKQLSVTDGNGKRTLFIDSFGNVSLDVTELKISSKQVATKTEIDESISLAVKDFITDDKLQENIDNAIANKISTEDLEKEVSKVKIESIQNTFKAISTEYSNNKRRAEILLVKLPDNNELQDAITNYESNYIILEGIVNSLGEDGILSEEELTNYSTALSNLQASSLTLMEVLQSSSDTITEEKTNSVIDDAIAELPTISDVESAENNAIIASKIETIKQIYATIEVEYTNVVEQANTIFNDTYLSGTAETNLNSAITDFEAKFEAITTAYNAIVEDNTLSTTELENWNIAIENFQTSTTAIAKRMQEAQTFINTAIYNAGVDYTDQAIPDALTGYAKTSYVDEAMQQAINDAKDGMVSSTDLTINNTEILMSAASMGQYNLLRNSDFRNGFDGWDCWGITNPHFREITTNDIRAMNGENNASIYSESSNVGNISLGNYQDVVLKPDSTYTISYWVNSVYSTMRAQIENIYSNNERTALAYKDYININGNRDRNTWKFDSITFTTPSDSSKVRVMFYVTRCEKTAYKALLVKPMLVSGNKAQAWTGHPDEIYVGVVSITEKKGLMVEHSNVNTKTVMSADGFSIEDNNGDVLAWLSSKEQWTELNVDKVFAGNVENLYEGPSSLYVNHSATVVGNGSSDKPFNSFAQIKEYLESTPIINKDLDIIVRDPGFEITEQLNLKNLKGSGLLKITLEGELVIRNIGNGQYSIYLSNIDKDVHIVGSRQFGSSTTGAYLKDNSTGGGGHGIFAKQVKRLEIDAITIACKNYGIKTERTYLYTWHVDFCKCYNAVELTYQSIYFPSDDVGSCTDYIRLKSGSFAYMGAGTVRPQGSIQQSSGVCYQTGSLTATKSDRYPNSTTNYEDATGSQMYTFNYNCTSKQSYMYANNSWSSDGSCKQGQYGYGLRGGHMFFDMATIRSQMTGTVQDGNTITLTRANNGGQSGPSNVYINGSTCSSASGTPSYSNNTLLGTLKWGETKTFTLPKAIVQSLVNGTCKSLAVYTSSTAANCYINITNASITLKTKK